MNESKLAGVLPVFQTPYHDDESIDFATLEREIDWLYELGVDGIVMAMVSEVLRLSTEERQELATAACKMSRGRAIISVGAESTRLAETYAGHAEQSGAAAVMAVPPVSIGVGEDELLVYFGRILRAIRFAGKENLIRTFHARAIALCGIRGQSCGKRFRPLDHEGAIEHEQFLHGRRGSSALLRVNIRVRVIELH